MGDYHKSGLTDMFNLAQSLQISPVSLHLAQPSYEIPL